MLVFLAVSTGSTETDRLVWPPKPDIARLEYVGEIDFNDLSPRSGFLGSIKRFLGGKTAQDMLSLPFDMVIMNKSIFLTCQNFQYLVEVSRADNSFRLHSDKKHPFAYPVALCKGGPGEIFISDSKNGSIYRYYDDKLTLFINDNLIRPTGLAASPEQQKLYVVDTGEHNVKIFDFDGNLLGQFPDSGMTEARLHYPTFAWIGEDGFLLVNDALNFRIARFDLDGNFVSAFGQEGDGPGAFSRPKGIATDSKGHIYVVDNLFDNLQIFNGEGQVLLAIGSGGQDRGQFWSPGGIDIVNDTIYIADTFNNRIQIFHYLGDSE